MSDREIMNAKGFGEQKKVKKKLRKGNQNNIPSK